MAIKYLAGDRLQGTAAERAALTTSVAQTDLVNTGNLGSSYNMTSEGITDIGFANSSKTGFGQVASFPTGDNPSSGDPAEMYFEKDFTAQSLVGGDDYCLGAWVKLIDNNTDQEVLDLRFEGGNNYIKFYHWSSNKWRGLVYIDGSAYSYLTSANDNANDGNWHHYMVERNGATHTFYIDNTSVATWDNSSSFTNFNQIRMGRWFEGEIDEAFFIRRDTTSAEKTSMQTGLIKNISSMFTDSALKFYFNCDSTHTYPNLTNGTIFEESDTGKHYMFDGSQTWNEM
jgi:hypothetical protein